MDIKQILEDLHSTLATSLLEELKASRGTGEPNERLMSVARQFLKDNDISGLNTGDSEVEKLVEEVDALDSLDDDTDDGEIGDYKLKVG